MDIRSQPVIDRKPDHACARHRLEHGRDVGDLIARFPAAAVDDDHCGEGTASFGDAGVHQQLATIRAGVSDVLPKAAAVASQPGREVLLPLPLVGAPVFELVNRARHEMEDAVGNRPAEGRGLSGRGFHVFCAMEHENGRVGRPLKFKA